MRTDIMDSAGHPSPSLDGEQVLRGLAEAVPQMVWTADPQGRKTWCSQRYLHYTGARNLQELDRLWMTYIHPEDRPLVLSAWQRSLASGEPYESQYRLRRYDGSYRDFLAQASAVRA